MLSEDLIQSTLQQLHVEMEKHSTKLDFIAANAATRTDLKELREEIVRNYVPLSVYETTISSLRETIRDLGKDHDDLKNELASTKRELNQAVDDSKREAMSAPEKALTIFGAALGILSGIILLLQHIKVF
jgi:chromosome segregation ATPase